MACDPIHEVVWPRGQRQFQAQPLAKRRDTLNGKTIAELWDLFPPGLGSTSVAAVAFDRLPANWEMLLDEAWA